MVDREEHFVAAVAQDQRVEFDVELVEFVEPAVLAGVPELRCEQGEPRFHVDRRVSGGRGRCGRLDGEAQFGEGAQLLLTVCGVQLPMDDLSAERVPLLDRLGDEPDASTDGDDFGCFEAFRDFACHGSRDVEPALELGVPTTATAAALYSRQASRGGADDILRVVSTMRAQFGGHVTRA